MRKGNSPIFGPTPPSGGVTPRSKTADCARVHQEVLAELGHGGLGVVYTRTICASRQASEADGEARS